MKYGQFLTDPWVGPPRMSMDTHLFIGQPWRMWFHFGSVDAPFGEQHEKYHTSYRVETDWNFWLEGKLPQQPCTMERIRKYGDGVVAFRDGFRFDTQNIRVVELDEAAHAEYLHEKELAFDECRTPAALIKRLAACAQRLCPDRTIPTDLTSSRSATIVATNLGIDRHLLSQARLVFELTNQIAELFDGG